MELQPLQNTTLLTQTERFRNPSTNLLTATLLSIFTGIGNAWAMGLFFLIAGYFPQYISCYLLGLIAFRRNWFLALSPRMGKDWSRTALIALLVPILLAIPYIGSTGAGGTQLDSILGGFYWQAYVLALWEVLMVVAVSIGLLALFRQRWNHHGRLAKSLAATAYTVYLIHPLVVGFTYAFHTVALYPLLKFVFAVLVALPLCFLIGLMIRKIPFANRVL